LHNNIAYAYDEGTIPAAWTEIKMVMIKPGKDHLLVKSWRPVVLSNTARKLGEKYTADRL